MLYFTELRKKEKSWHFIDCQFIVFFAPYCDGIAKDLRHEFLWLNIYIYCTNYVLSSSNAISTIFHHVSHSHPQIPAMKNRHTKQPTPLFSYMAYYVCEHPLILCYVFSDVFESHYISFSKWDIIGTHRNLLTGRAALVTYMCEILVLSWCLPHPLHDD